MRTDEPTISTVLTTTPGTRGVSLERYTETLFGQEYAKLDYWQIGLSDLFASPYLNGVSPLGTALSAVMRMGLGGRAQRKIDILERMERHRGKLDESRFFLLVNFRHGSEIG